MKKLLMLALLASALVAGPAQAVSRGSWLGSVGIGVAFDPASFTINPQLEYAFRPWLLFGPNLQIITGAGTIFTVSASGRALFGSSYVKPFLDFGLGLTIASGYASSFGLHAHVGMGFDYVVSKSLMLGTLIRFNFMPPVRNLLVVWDILTFRFAF